MVAGGAAAPGGSVVVKLPAPSWFVPAAYPLQAGAAAVTSKALLCAGSRPGDAAVSV